MSMTRQFYSYRKGRRDPLTGAFFNAYTETLKRLTKTFHFARYFPRYSDGSGVDHRPANAKIMELIGNSWTPFDPNEHLARPKTEEAVIDIIEAFWELAEEAHLYEGEVNTLFARFNQPYSIQGGLVQRHGSDVLDRLFELEIQSADHTLIKYIERAVGDFLYAKEDRRLEGLRSLYDAFERLKSSMGNDKKESVNALIHHLAPPTLGNSVNELLHALTTIGNDANIRHSEHRVTLINHDPELIEFLFYTMFAFIRAALHKLKPL